MSRKKHHYDPEPICNCEECGSNLYDENNILLEIKSAMDAYLDEVDPTVVGRPLYVIVIGDCGYEMAASPINCIEGIDNDKAIINTLTDMKKYLKKKVKSNKK